MKKMIKLIVIAISFLLLGMEVFSQAANFTTTGSAIRVKKIAFVSVNVYAITHQMKDIPEARSAAEFINAETDKRFILKMKRDVDSAKIVTAINDAFGLNGYSNKANQDTFYESYLVYLVWKNRSTKSNYCTRWQIINSNTILSISY